VTWTQGLWAVDGNPLPGSLWRLQLQSATRGGQGIVGAADLYVKQTAAASSQIRVSNGACVIAGGEANWQGSYYGYNVGDDLISIAATGGSGRSDMVVAKVEDPTVSGAGWSHNPLSEQLVYSRVISGVTAGSTTPPAGITAIPLARVDVPASTSAITQAMITDLRSMLNARRDRTLIAVNLSGGPYNLLNSATSWATWPSVASFSVPVPAWAVTARIVCYWVQVLSRWVAGSTSGPFANVRFQLGSLISQSMILDSSTFQTASNPYRDTGLCVDTLSIPSAMRGTSQTFVMQGQGKGPTGAGGASYWSMDTSSGYVTDIEWQEALQTQ
jgi:hypothetical protein